MKKIVALLLSIFMLFSIFTVSVCATETDETIITVSGGVVNPGSIVNINISVKNNPGISAMAFCVAYDKDAFEYIDYTNGYLNNYTIKNHTDKGIVSFVNVEDRNLITNGVMLTLNFKVNPNAENGEYVFEIKNNNPDKYGNELHNSFVNSAEQFISVKSVAGIVVVDGDFIAHKGDVNGDGNIDNKDYALLMQYLNGWDVEIIENVADVNADSKIDNKDYALLMQYLNGWDVELK